MISNNCAEGKFKSTVSLLRGNPWWHHLFQELPETLWERDTPALRTSMWPQVSQNSDQVRRRAVEMLVLGPNSPAHSQGNE